ncbi:hypothetical protein ACKTEK_09930 [Tepidamorphus sp. 3E244]|uniref:hypothetical protein n=1 Tax=Tepidamorphus sp. 3E244 TaxID=3385498 RepID=UPI0038FD088C
MEPRDERVVVHENGGASATWLIAGILIAVLAGAAFLYSGGFFNGGDSVNVDLQVPDVSAPAGDGGSAGGSAGGEGGTAN